MDLGLFESRYAAGPRRVAFRAGYYRLTAERSRHFRLQESTGNAYPAAVAQRLAAKKIESEA